VSGGYYISGGTLAGDALCYVRRAADDQLYAALREGEFCYVLTPRQMGKSSLMARAAAQLRSAGAAVAVIDLTLIGSHLDAERWYNGLLDQIGIGLNLEDELETYFRAHPHLSPLQRWQRALREVALERIADPVIIFVDEIDLTGGLPFSADEFFAAIRACYNARAEDACYDRLTFCLLGVAMPTDLIRNPRLTPFNIGRRIELHDFTLEETEQLAPGLGRDRASNLRLMRRIYYWTGGHPYLTQRLCREVAEREAVTPAAVDRVCNDLFFAPAAERTDSNLLFVRQRLLATEEQQEANREAWEREDRAALLTLYGQVRAGRRAPANETVALIAQLALSGVVRADHGRLRVRNRIYAHVFDRAWIQKHLPDAEARRQRSAYYRGFLRAAAVGIAGLLGVSSLAFIAITQARYAREAARRADRERNITRNLLYAADMNLASQAYNNGDYGRLAQLLEAHRPGSDDGPDLRGFEWHYLWRLMHQDHHTFIQPGTAIVSSVAFSPDGKTLVAASEDGAVKLRDFPSGREVGTLQGPSEGIYAISYSPNGRLLATANLNKTVSLWNVAARRVVTLLCGDDVYSVAFSPDSRLLAAGDKFGTVKLWDAATCQEIAATRVDRNVVYGLAFSPDGRWLASGNNNGTIHLWRAPAGAFFANPCAFTLAPGKQLLSLAFSPESRLMAVGRTDGVVEIWNVLTRHKMRMLTGHRTAINGLAFSPDGRVLASGSWDDTVRLWNVATGQQIGPPFIGHTNRVTSVAFSPDSRWLVSGGGSDVKIWDPWRRKLDPRSFAVFPFQLIHPLGLSPTGAFGQFLFDTKHSLLMLQDVTGQGALMRSVIPHVTYTAALSHNGKRLAIGTLTGTVTVQDVGALQQARILCLDRQSGYAVASLAFSPDDRMLAAASGDPALVRVWDLATGQLLAHFQHSNDAEGIAFSSDGKTLAAANWQGRVYLWDITANRLIDRWWAHAGPVKDVAFSPDGKTLATASDDHTVKLWNVATRREMVILTGPRQPVRTILFSPDGNRLCAMCEGPTGNEGWIWDASETSH
jgi:WD40 repeat protein